MIHTYANRNISAEDCVRESSVVELSSVSMSLESAARKCSLHSRFSYSQFVVLYTMHSVLHRLKGVSCRWCEDATEEP